MPITNESNYLPCETSSLPVGSWLVLAPHPDDETFGMGGTLLHAKAENITVDVIFMTDGSKGGDQESLVKIREIEAKKVADKLGIRKAYFWSEVDRELTASKHLISKLSQFIKRSKPGTVFFPSPSEPHPDHRTTSVIAWESLRLINFIATPISYDISVQGHTNCLIDISQVIEQKRELMAEYHSQLSENSYIDRIIALNQARTWSLPQSVSHAESFYQWPKENRPLNALVLSLAAQDSSFQALPDSLPLISVITRTKNRPEFLREAIRSVAGQTYQNIELIVVNDGGTDCEALVAEEAVGHIQQYHYQHSDTQTGRSNAANTGLKLCHGKFIIFLDDDDWFESHHINTLYEQLMTNEGAIVAYSSVRCVNDKGETIFTLDFEFDSTQLCINNYIPIHAVLFRSTVIDKNCSFDENLTFYEDWDFWIQVQQYGYFSFVPTIGAIYNIHKGGSGLWGDFVASKKFILQIYKKWLPLWDEDTLWEIFEYARYKKQFFDKEQELLQTIQVLDDKNQALSEKDQELLQTIQVLDDKNQSLSNIEQVLARKDQELLEKDDELQKIIIAMEEKIKETSNMITFLEEEKKLLYSSTSWKITKPLRGIKNIMIGVKKILKKIIYLFWRKLPINIQQRIKFKANFMRLLPTLSRFLKLSSVPDTEIGWETLNSNHYSSEYHFRLQTASIDPSWTGSVPLAGDNIDSTRTSIKVIAFYLPQFHPIPTNNAEWGEGFTEWTNVSKSVPQYVGHYQPRLPGELGYYDLRLKEVQKRQIELAKQYGIDGFCYYHYWFGGEKVLEKPFQQVLDDPLLDLPFCLCWANENWTRTWDGGEDNIILEQHYSAEDDIEFIKDITPALKDKRYIRVNGKPLLIVYRPSLLPDAAATAARWRKYTIEQGIGDLHIVSAATFGFEDFESINYDGLVQFPPHNIDISDVTAEATLLNENYTGSIFDFKKFSKSAINFLKGRQHTFPCVMMNWDNGARKPGNGHSFHDASPENYKSWLHNSFDFVQKNNTQEEQIVFINAWNEWAEGTYLEPDRRYGYAYLHATANVVKEYYNDQDLSYVIEHNNNFIKTSNTAIVIHLYYPEIADEILEYLNNATKVDYFINFSDHIDSNIVKSFCVSTRNTYITVSPNKGRDILPFITALSKVSFLGYDYLLKVHSKKTMYRKDGEKIRKSLFKELMGKINVSEIIDHFESDKELGLIAPTGSIISLSHKEYLHGNIDNMEILLSRLKKSSIPIDFDFIAGSMFWTRVNAIKPILDINLIPDDFDDELGQLDGTMAHAIERIFVFIANNEGYKTITLDTLIKNK